MPKSEVNVPVTIREHPERTLWLHEQVASGTTADGEKLRALIPVPPSCVVVQVGRRNFSVSIDSLVGAVLTAIEEGIETPEGKPPKEETT